MVSGTVTDGSTAMTDVNVMVLNTAGNPVRGDTTDAQGWYQIDQLPAAQLTCKFTKAGFATATHVIDLSQTQTATLNVSLTLLASISGNVSPATASVPVILAGAGDTYSAETDVNGSFSATGLPSGSYTLIVKGWDQGQMTVVAGPHTLTSGQQLSVGTIDISVNNAGTIAGTVDFDYTFGSGAPTGNPDEPIEGVPIYAERDGIVYGYATTASDGSFSIPRLPTGTYTVGNADLFTFLPEETIVDPGLEIVGTTTAGVQVTASQTTTANLEFLRGGTFIVVLQDANDAHVSGATITVANGASETVETGNIEEMVDCYVCWRPLAPGDYTLTVSKAGYETHEGALNIVAAKRRVVTVTLEAE